MRLLRVLLARVAGLFHSPSRDRELAAEFAAHLDLATDEYIRRGLPPGEARRRARIDAGSLTAAAEAYRDQRGIPAAETLARHVRFAVRSLRRSPGLTAIVVISLSLGIGATSALFSFVDALFLAAPARVAASGELRRLYETSTHTFDGLPTLRSRFWYTDFLALRDAIAPAAHITAFTPPESVSVGRGDEATLQATYVSAGYFEELGVAPALGRSFEPDEERMGAPRQVVVIGDALWHSAFGGRADVLGQSIVLGGRTFTVVGVAPTGFTGTDLDATDIWLPLADYPKRSLVPGNGPQSKRPWYEVALPPRWGPGPLQLLARVRDLPDASLATVGTTVLRRLYPGDPSVAVRIGPIAQAMGPTVAGAVSGYGTGQSQQLQTNPSVAISTRLTAVVALLLLIACANVANLLLGRAMTRRRETAIRLALGASRRQLAAQHLTESLLLAIVAGLVSLAVAAWGGEAVRALLLPATHWGHAAFDGRVALFTIAITSSVGLLVGVVPACQASAPDLGPTLKGGARGGESRRATVRNALVVVQVALSVLLLVGAGVFLRSLARVQSVGLGYDVERLVTGRVDLAAGGVSSGDGSHVSPVGVGLADVARRLEGAPGIERVALAGTPPMQGAQFAPLHLPGRDSLPVAGGERSAPPFVLVSPSYFATVGLQLVAGRSFTDADRPQRDPVDESWHAVIVNETMARTLWPGQEAVGQCMIVLGPRHDCTTVVGVVSDAHLAHIVEQPTMMYYLPLRRDAGGVLDAAHVVIVRAESGQEAIAAERLREALRQRFPTTKPPIVETMASALAPQLRPWRLGATIFTAFGLLALLVAVIGVYGVVSYAASQRTQEMAIRVAVGAQRQDVIRLVVGDGLRGVAMGVLLGSGLAILAGRAVASILYDTSPRDPLVLLGVALLLCAGGVVASVLPAWRTSRVDPADVLRVD